MMHLLKSKTFYKRILLIAIIIYVCYIFFNQQKSLATYKNQQKQYEKQIAEQKDKNVELVKLKENVNSEEYIEEIAREKLDMYLPNERVYIDISK